MRSDFRANHTERAIINYLIESVLAGKTFRSIDKSFLEIPSVRGKGNLWSTIMGSIRGQLALNPEDKKGFSITPEWVREVYVDYWKIKNPVVWNPGMDIPEFEKPNRKEEVPKRWYAYSTKEDVAGKILHLFPIKDENLSFYRGFLRAVKAEKWYQVTLEELEVDNS